MFLCGCAAVTTPEHPGKVWIAPKNAIRADAVWKELRAESRDFAKALTLAELTDMALANHPVSRKAWLEARMAAERVTVAEGYFLPSLQATVSAGVQTTSAKPGSFDSDYMKYGPGLQLNYMIINFGGGRAAAIEQALQTVNAADFAFNRALQDILLSVETAYYATVSAAAGIDVADAAVKDAGKTLEVAEARLKQGVGTELEVLQAKTGFDQALYNKASADGLLKIACGSLAQTIGVPADTDIKVAQPVAAVPGSIGEKDLRKLIDGALERRPDISALRATLAASEAAVKVSSAAYWPSLFLNGSLSQNSYNVNSGREMQDSDLSYNGALSLQWTLFDGFQNTSRHRIAAAQAEATRAQLRQAELAASAEVWTRYHNYQTALERHRFSKAYLESATAAHGLALDSYKAQLIGITDLLHAETQLARARTQTVAAMQEVFTALAGLAHSTGLLEHGGTGAAELVQP
jgi:outer membrane protein TolC